MQEYVNISVYLTSPPLKSWICHEILSIFSCNSEVFWNSKKTSKKYFLGTTLIVSHSFLESNIQRIKLSGGVELARECTPFYSPYDPRLQSSRITLSTVAT